jgi:hypothetical protein
MFKNSHEVSKLRFEWFPALNIKEHYNVLTLSIKTRFKDGVMLTNLSASTSKPGRGPLDIQAYLVW